MRCCLERFIFISVYKQFQPLKVITSTNSKKRIKMAILNVLVHPLARNQNILKVCLQKLKGLKDL